MIVVKDGKYYNCNAGDVMMLERGRLMPKSFQLGDRVGKPDPNSEDWKTRQYYEFIAVKWQTVRDNKYKRIWMRGNRRLIAIKMIDDFRDVEKFPFGIPVKANGRFFLANVKDVEGWLLGENLGEHLYSAGVLRFKDYLEL